MARPPRIEFAGAVYHVTCRGNARQRIFLDGQDNRRFLELLGKTLERFQWICHAYCLMVNHYHLMIETPEANLSKGMHHLNTHVTQAHNKRYEAVGHLLQGRFKSIIVDRESYLLELARYVVLNPVRAGMATHPEGWPWSSYRVTAGLPPSPIAPAAPAWFDPAWLLGQFGPDEAAARERYRDFVAAGIGLKAPWSQRQRYASRPPLKEIFGEWTSRRRRDEAIVASYATYGYGQKEIATFLGIHYTSVCRVIRRHDVKR